MTRRPAVTVIEALMAILVMAIGLLALLTLFPLGAVSMYQSIKDERCAEVSINATAQFKAFGIGSSPDVVIASPSGTGTIFEDPWPLLTAGAPGVPSLITSGYTGPTYPVWIDPIGQYNGNYYVVPKGAGPTVTGVTVGTAPPLGIWPTSGGIARAIPRATLNQTSTVIPSPTVPPLWQWQLRWFTLQDDITYLDNGLPDTSPGYVQREGRYSFSYVVRRQSPGIAGPLDLTVVVYTGRSAGTDPNGNPLGETVYGDSSGTTGTVLWGVTASGGQDANTVTINWAGVPTKPALRRGNWILDARMVVDPTAVTLVPNPQGYFYRVVSVTDVGTNLMEVVVQRPLGGQLRSPWPGPPVAPYQGPLVVVDNVAEVFEKGTVY